MMVRRRNLGVRFRRQHPVGDYIVDFISLPARLIIEVDGSHHEESEHDESRDECLRRGGLRVLRFWNEEVAFDPDWVEQTIKEWIADPQRGMDGDRYPG